MDQKTCSICNGPNHTNEAMCAECSKMWVRNPVGINLATGKALGIRDALSWWLRANDLVVAAHVLLEDWNQAYEIFGESLKIGSADGLSNEQAVAYSKLRLVAVAEMLIGMAFECAAKALIIGADSSIVNDKKRWKDLTQDHNLNRYFDQTPLRATLSPEDRSLLVRLQEAVEWRGRYPGSKKDPDMYMQISSDKNFAGWEDIWRRLREQYQYE